MAMTEWTMRLYSFARQFLLSGLQWNSVAAHMMEQRLRGEKKKEEGLLLWEASGPEATMSVAASSLIFRSVLVFSSLENTFSVESLSSQFTCKSSGSMSESPMMSNAASTTSSSLVVLVSLFFVNVFPSQSLSNEISACTKRFFALANLVIS